MCVCMCILHSSGRKRRTRMKKGDTLLFLLRGKQIFLDQNYPQNISLYGFHSFLFFSENLQKATLVCLFGGTNGIGVG